MGMKRLKNLAEGVGSIAKGLVGSGLGEFKDAVTGYINGKIDMPEADRRAMDRDLEIIRADIELRKTEQFNKESAEFREYVLEYEGGVSQLMSIPYVGPFLVLMRNLLKLCIGFGTIYLDYKIFSSQWSLAKVAEVSPELAGQESALLWAINIIVLVGTYGEQASRALAPLAERYFGKKAGEK